MLSLCECMYVLRVVSSSGGSCFTVCSEAVSIRRLVCVLVVVVVVVVGGAWPWCLARVVVYKLRFH